MHEIGAESPIDSQIEETTTNVHYLGDALEMKKRSVVISGHRTSVSLENAFWYALKEIATRNEQTVNQLVSEIDDGRTGNLSSAIRVYVFLDAQRRRR
tara:strand:+ start:230 stop:523 length:294 start_codon:yes stop_codon:yes gene_type:complete